MEEKTVNTILETLAKEIRSLKIDLYLKESENERLREENKSLKEKLDLGNRPVRAVAENG